MNIVFQKASKMGAKMRIGATFSAGMASELKPDPSETTKLTKTTSLCPLKSQDDTPNCDMLVKIDATIPKLTPKTVTI